MMGQSDVVVLGTSFNLKLTINTIELSVKTGRVQFSPYYNGATSILIAGQALSYDLQKKELMAKPADNSDSWLTKELVFVDTPLEEVCKQLTDYYGIVIKLDNKKHAAKKLNAKFTDQPLDDVLLVLNETYGIKINKEQNQIHLITP
jgi:transmembrane sensor